MGLVGDRGAEYPGLLEDDDRWLARSWQLAPGVELVLLDGGVLVRGRESSRVDCHSRELERDLVAALGAGDVRPVYEAHTAAEVERALATLASLGALVPRRRARVVDLRSQPSRAELSPTPEPLVVVARIDDERASAWLDAAEQAQASCAFVWTSGSEIAVVRHDPSLRPCARCALLFDTTAQRAAVPDALVAQLQHALDMGLASGDALVGRVAGAWAERLAQPDARWPEPGEAIRLDVAEWSLCRERYGPHPSCARCHPPGVTHSRKHRRSETLGWDDLAARRFAPLACAPGEAASGVARVVFRRSRKPWPVAASAFGAGSAFGPDARTRALAEGIERFAMLHCPADVSAARARELGDFAIGDAAIRELLFRDSERQRPGFRFDDFSPDTAYAWSWATEARSGERRLVPSTLVGRPPEGSPALVDATSNGYAAHTSRNDAITRAISEVVERDAVLAAWYTGSALQRVDVTASAEASELPSALGVFVATNEIDLPVFWLVARCDDGSMRCASAAGPCALGAWRRAARELRAAFAVTASPRNPERELPSEDLDDAARRHGPRHHFAYYAAPERCAPLLDRLAREPVVTLEAVARRWPEPAGDPLDTLLAALDRASFRAWIVDRSLPDVFPGWHVVRALIPGTVELSWGQAYRRLASARLAVRLADCGGPCPWPHPVA